MTDQILKFCFPPEERPMSIPTVAVYNHENELLHEQGVVFGPGEHTDTHWVWENKHGFEFKAQSQPAYGYIKFDGVPLLKVELTLDGEFNPEQYVHFAKGAITAEELKV